MPKRLFYTNPDARTFDEHVKYKRKPCGVSPLCHTGYHQPDFGGGRDQCERVGCRCYCHHPKEVEAYKDREGTCSTCGGSGTWRGRSCPTCYGSGYGHGQPVTWTERKQVAQPPSKGGAA